MSYNISRFIVKKLDELSFPVDSLFKHERTDWHFERTAHEDGTAEFSGMAFKLVGKIVGDRFFAESIECRNEEGSGTEMYWILEPALKESRGEFVASCVWESGDSINRLIVKDGSASWVDIEI